MSIRDSTNPIWCLFDAAAQHHTIRMDCPRCRRSTVFHAAALWWLFERKGWNEDLRGVPRRFYCQMCRGATGTKVRPRVMLVKEHPTVHLPLPDDAEWKRAISRRR